MSSAALNFPSPLIYRQSQLENFTVTAFLLPASTRAKLLIYLWPPLAVNTVA